MNFRGVVIVVPMYRVAMNEFETVSWQQLQRVLGAYPICMIAPVSIAKELSVHYQVQVEAFPDDCFRSVQSYSRMMLASDFYRRFRTFTYMLLYQLDAFVFSDLLMDFCKRGYDYIGAPWPRWCMAFQSVTKNCVGNGGLSLRKISSACRILEQKDDILNGMDKEAQAFCLRAEDAFWSRCGCIPALNFRVAPYTVAKCFSIEHQNHIPADFAKQLPFGCHGWSRSTYWFWRPIIEQFDYALPESNMMDSRQLRRIMLGRYLLNRIMKKSVNGEYLRTFMQTILPNNRGYAIWGWGTYGRLSEHILHYAGYKIQTIYDQSAIDQNKGEKIKSPDLKEIRAAEFYIVVGSIKYDNEICGKLSQVGLQEEKDYIRIATLLECLSKSYLRSFISRS